LQPGAAAFARSKIMKNRYKLIPVWVAIIFILAGAGCTPVPTPTLMSTPKPKTNSLFVPRVEGNSASSQSLPYPVPITGTQLSTKNPNSPDYPSGTATDNATAAPKVTDTLVPPTDAPPTETLTPSPTTEPTKPPAPTLFWPTPVPGETATPYPRPSGDHGESLPPEQWQQWPVIPVVSQRARQIYQSGLAKGNDPKKFSKVGDCQNIRQYFLGMFDAPVTYYLGEKYGYLSSTISHFSGSWNRLSESVRTGFNVASVLTSLYANPGNCHPGESPIACEFRIWNPSIAIISMETWTAGRPTSLYESYLRQIVEFSISQGVLPILATKADNLEGDNSINLIVARIARDYDIPLWNFWAAAQPLPDHGLTGDNFHLTPGSNFFNRDGILSLGWPVRNLTALQAIDAVLKAVK
jgi:hypothetical protein